IIALDDIVCRFAGGEVTAIIGPSGCGKSTLLQITRGLLTPTRGTVAFRYRNEGAIADGPQARMAAVWQRFQLFHWLSVIDNVAFGLKMAGVSRELCHAKAAQAVQDDDLAG